jgi:predicted metalloenzyme YecM
MVRLKLKKFGHIPNKQLINGSWFYAIEWRSPALVIPGNVEVCILPVSENKPKFNPHLAWVSDYDLIGV